MITITRVKNLYTSSIIITIICLILFVLFYIQGTLHLCMNSSLTALFVCVCVCDAKWHDLLLVSNKSINKESTTLTSTLQIIICLTQAKTIATNKRGHWSYHNKMNANFHHSIFLAFFLSFFFFFFPMFLSMSSCLCLDISSVINYYW